MQRDQSPTTAHSRRFNAESWAVLGAALLALALGGTLIWLRLAGPSDGARLRIEEIPWRLDGVVVAPLEEWPGGLRRGDRVVAVDGQSAEALARALFLPGARRPPWRVGQAVVYTVLRDGRSTTLRISLRPYPLRALVAQLWGAMLVGLLTLIVTAFAFFKRPGDQAARSVFAGIAGINAANLWSLSPQVNDLVDRSLFWLSLATACGAFLLIWMAAFRFWLGFARYQAARRRSRWLTLLLYSLPVAAYLGALGWPGPTSTLTWLGRAHQAFLAFGATYLPVTVAAMLIGYHATTDPAGRQRVRLVVGTALVCGGSVVALGPLAIMILGHPLIDRNILSLFILPVVVAFALAILRYHLFDIDVIISRSLVYGALTASIVALYVVVVGALSTLLQARGSLAISLLATGIVALLFQPLRERLQRFVNHMLYGERDDPYTVLARLGERLETTLAPDTVLPMIVETVGQALKLPYVALALAQGDGFESAAAYGTPQGVPLVVPLAYQGATVGRLILARRAPGEALSPADQRLVADLARQIEVAVHAVRLTADLQRSRERLVTAREEERRRLRRDLHDGLGPALASLTLKLDAARNLLARDPPAADALLLELKAQTQAAIADIRRLVYALRPPALDDLGLVSALREQAARYGGPGLRVVVEAPERLPPLPAAVEVAAYRIALEALTNVAHHARARACHIRLDLADALCLEVTDDGVGLAPAYRAGVGMTSMRERAMELGGSWTVESMPGAGTRVVARLPLAASAGGSVDAPRVKEASDGTDAGADR